MRIFTKLALLGMVAVVAASSKGAIVVYDNTPLSDPNVGAVAGASEATTNVVRAMDFKIAGAASNHITDVTWWGTYLPTAVAAPVDNFTIAFYADNGSKFPQAAPISTQSVIPVRLSTGQTTFFTGTTPEFKYTASLAAPVDLNGSVLYWMSIYDTTGGANGTYWAWRTVDSLQPGLNGDAIRNPQSATPLAWNNFHTSYAEAFQLLTVPEPTSLALLILSTPALLLRRRNRTVCTERRKVGYNP